MMKVTQNSGLSDFSITKKSLKVTISLVYVTQFVFSFLNFSIHENWNFVASFTHRT